MLTLSHVFTDGALYQAQSELTVRGKAAPSSTVTLKLTRDSDGAQVSFSEVRADENGIFDIVFTTPEASFDEYTITIEAENETQIIHRVLFGELWLASGQSNMELTNSWIEDNDKMFDEVKDKVIRVFSVGYPSGDFEFPFDPDPTTYGFWIYSDEGEKLNNVSAIGLKFASEVYDYLNKDKDCPVGFLNVSWGGTMICHWLPRDVLPSSGNLYDYLKKFDFYPTKENWNTKKEFNFLQTSVQYNYKTAPIEGLKCRGIIWYQGESDSGGEYYEKMYAEALKLYYKTYSDRFAADKDNFKMISVLIFPWGWGHDGKAGSCHLGYLNDAFVKTAKEEPDKFAVVPIGDLEPSWSYHLNNHPIHPTHKYEVGHRVARIALANSYNADMQKSPVMLDHHEICGDKILLKLTSDKYPIKVGDGRAKNKAHCLYIAGEDNIYLPAEYKIISNDTIEIWCDEIKEPKNACYAFQSFDVKCNIFAGEYLLAPFSTDIETLIEVEAHRWYDAAESVIWVEEVTAFFHPLWKPLGNSEVCHDTAFCRDSVASVRVCADIDSTNDPHEYGAYITSHSFNKLDLYRFAAIEADFLNAKDVEITLRLKSENGEMTIPFTKIGEEKFGWTRFSASLEVIPEGEIKTMAFCFKDSRENNHFANIEKIRLIKK